MANYIAVGIVGIAVLIVAMIIIFVSIKWRKRNRGGYVKKRPLDLLRPNRFDVTAKYLYGKHREQKTKSNYFMDLYREHLRVWNGFKECDNLNKSNFHNFQQCFHGILDSIKEKGFLSELSLVPITRDSYVVNGAHRLAACILYKKPVKCRHRAGRDGKIDFGYAFFEESGLEEHYRDIMALTYCKLKKNTFVATLFPSAVGHDEKVKNILNQFGEVIYEKKVHIKNNGPVNLIREMYKGEEWGGDWSNGFEGMRRKAGWCFKTEGITRVFIVEFEDVKQAHAAKKKIRKIYKIGNDAMHINDTHAETMRLSRILLNNNSIHRLNYSNIVYYQRFEEALKCFKRHIEAKKLDMDDFCITASASLSAYGLREAEDLDYLHFRDQQIVKGHALIHSHNVHAEAYPAHKDEIIYDPRNHFYYDDLKFVSLGILEEFKKTRGEPKDKVDVELIGGVCSSSGY